MSRASGKAEEILDVAEHMARNDGYNGFSFRDIADAVAVKSASVHYHFPSKADLGTALARRYTERFMAELGDPEDSDRTPDDLLRGFVAAYRRALAVDGLMCLCGMFAAEVAALPPPVAEETRRFFDANLTWLAQVVVRTGEPKVAAGARALALLAAVEGAMLIARARDGVADFDGVIGELAKAGLLPADAAGRGP